MEIHEDGITVIREAIDSLIYRLRGCVCGVTWEEGKEMQHIDPCEVAEALEWLEVTP